MKFKSSLLQTIVVFSISSLMVACVAAPETGQLDCIDQDRTSDRCQPSSSGGIQGGGAYPVYAPGSSSTPKDAQSVKDLGKASSKSNAGQSSNTAPKIGGRTGFGSFGRGSAGG